MKSHIAEYLEYYCSLERPGYAVLVTGAWGIGKTFQVKECIPDEKRYYVSLFGVQTVEQLHAEVFAVASPVISKADATMRKVADAAANAGGVFGFAGAVPSILNAVLRRKIKPDRTLVFDDLERSELELKDALGAINSYVEQQGFKVVVIAHDEKMTNDFLQMKEKTFGQTIRAEPQIESAFDFFLSEVSEDSSRDFISLHKSSLVSLFEGSGEKSLRILRHLVDDLARIHSLLCDEHLANSRAILDLIKLFSAFDIEVRNGSLLEDDLRNRTGVKVSYLYESRKVTNNPNVKPRLVISDAKYPAVDLESGLLNDECLISMLIEGRYNEQILHNSLSNSVYFLKPEDAAPWKIVINFCELEDEVVEKAQLKIEKQFSSREVTESGELLHIFALKMMMAENGAFDGSIEDVCAQCKAYVDDLKNTGRLPQCGTDWRWKDEFETGHESFAYWVSELAKPHFDEIRNHLIHSREQVLVERFPEICAELMSRMKSDPHSFFNMISQTNNGNNTYALIPVFTGMQPKVFVHAWLSSPHSNWRTINSAIRNRYTVNRLDAELVSEKEWALAVYHELNASAAEAKGLAALRIKRIIPEVLRQLAEEQATSTP